ncbi:unnamed protein product [Bursaphelenchus xylophilus]|uniref:(pine wood nematode) hypothetical protein n=1 Tax=Bursaphelenchus xylophilus TaxID=6326 RepID=A0A1I7S5S9_BURXY|nr:unnamed protein product [Bursaphelenchus xylophilus]CAG9125029.1 unnamed protein product [Bursaphelenchus xylophilus]
MNFCRKSEKLIENGESFAKSSRIASRNRGFHLQFFIFRMISRSVFLYALILALAHAAAVNNTSNRTPKHQPEETAKSVGNHTEMSRNLTADDAELHMEFMTELENSILREVLGLENATGYYFNQTTIIFSDLMNDPCVRNGNSTLPAIFAFIVGLIAFPILKCSCAALCRRGKNARIQRRYLRGENKGDVSGLNKLIQEATANDSEVDM